MTRIRKVAGKIHHKARASRPKSRIWLGKSPFPPLGFAYALFFCNTFVLCWGNGVRNTAALQVNSAFALHGSVGSKSIYLLLYL
jgi:hypothetical protein